MIHKLSFQGLNEICQALGTFAEARSKPAEEKDVILTVMDVGGRKTLRAVRLSEMPAYSRMGHHLGFGDSTLKAVAHFLETREPFLPQEACLYNKSSLSFHYTDEAVDSLLSMEKKHIKALKKVKAAGCDAFKRCLVDHNKKKSNKIYMLLQEDEKISLTSSRSFGVFAAGKTIGYSYPNPMGPFKNEETRALAARYKPPRLEESEFLYLDPFFRRNRCKVAPGILGFCYEFGLGTKKNNLEAVRNYRLAAQDDDYAACNNLARLLLTQEKTSEALSLFERCENILLNNMTAASEIYNQVVEERKPILEECVKKWTKDLKKVYSGFIVVYAKINNPILKAEYEQKILQPDLSASLRF